MHHLVTKMHQLHIIKVIFPIREHSYLEFGRNMNLINQKTYTKVPDDWRKILRSSQLKPYLFQVIDHSGDVEFHDWTDVLTEFYPKVYQFLTSLIRVLNIE